VALARRMVMTARHRRGASSATSSRSAFPRVIGRQSPAVLVFAAAVIVSLTLIPFLFATDPTGSLASTLPVAALFSVFIGIVALIASSRVVIVNDSVLRFVNLVIVREAQRRSISRVDVKYGLEVYTADGRRLRSLAFGDSAMGAVFGYRRASRTARAITEWLEGAATISSPGAEPARPTSRVRDACRLPLVAWCLAYCGFVLAVRFVA
jgi:hypothetical protein